MKFLSLLIVVLFAVSCAYASSDIVGGIPANQRQLPFIVSLNVCGVQCAGFLISDTHVGTAGHCFSASNASASCTTVQAGTNDVSSSANGQIRNVSSFNVHPLFNDVTFRNDAAIITLASPFTIDNTNVRIAPLESNSSNLPSVNTTVYVAGWGNTATAGPNSPNSLLFVGLPYFNFTNCNSTFNGSLLQGNQICAGGSVGNDSCKGDDGAPLFTTSNILTPTDAKIIGIVSFRGQNCATVGTPGVYSDVPGFAFAFFQSIIANSASVAASSIPVTSALPSSIAATSPGVSSKAASSVVVPSSTGAAASSSGASVAASSLGASVAASSPGASVAASSLGASVAASSKVVVASSAVVAASSNVVAASSNVVAASSVAAAASSGAVAASKTQTASQSSTPSNSAPVVASSGAVAASSGVKSSASAASTTPSKNVSVKTKTGLAAITCRRTCNITFRQCKKTTRRLRTCKRAKKVCVSGCGVINPNKN